MANRPSSLNKISRSPARMRVPAPRPRSFQSDLPRVALERYEFDLRRRGRVAVEPEEYVVPSNASGHVVAHVLVFITLGELAVGQIVERASRVVPGRDEDHCPGVGRFDDRRTRTGGKRSRPRGLIDQRAVFDSQHDEKLIIQDRDERLAADVE